MTSTPLPGYPVRIVRLISMAPTGAQVTITTHFKPVGNGFDKPLAAWSLTQIPWPERVLVRIPEQADRQSYLQRTPAKEDLFVTRSLGATLVELTRPDEQSAKTFVEADIIDCVYDDVLFLQRQLAAPNGDPWAPHQRAQIFCNTAHAAEVPPGPRYGELEWTAPLAPTQRLGLNPLRVTWDLVQMKGKRSDAELAKLLKEK
ncbi:MAG: hypothetical protein WCI73_16400 [Phycisphaerae bacterium]